MALKTLEGVEEIGGFKVIVMDELREKYPDRFNPDGSMQWEWFENDIRPNHFIYVRKDKNSLSFTLQNGPIKENGINGCQVDTIIEAALVMIKGLNEKFPCEHNSKAMFCLSEALDHLAERQRDRISRGVEGLNKE